VVPGLFLIRLDTHIGETIGQGEIPLRLPDFFVREHLSFLEGQIPVEKRPGIQRSAGETYRTEKIAGTGVIDDLDIGGPFPEVNPHLLNEKVAVEVAPADGDIVNPPLCLFINLMTQYHPRSEGKVCHQGTKVLLIPSRSFNTDGDTPHQDRVPSGHRDLHLHVAFRRRFLGYCRRPVIIAEWLQSFLHLAGNLVQKMIQPGLVDSILLDETRRHDKGRLDIFQFLAFQTLNKHFHGGGSPGQRGRQQDDQEWNKAFIRIQTFPRQR